MSALKIDERFVNEWEPKYRVLEDDDGEYYEIIAKVKKDILESGTLSERTFERIYDWKAKRAKHYVDWISYEKYAQRFKQVLDSNLERRLEILLEPHLKGIGIPVASTVLHFMFENIFPIIDFRTVEVLKRAKLLDASKSLYYIRDTVEGYVGFCAAMREASSSCPNRSLREIDRALFAYHKKIIGEHKHHSRN